MAEEFAEKFERFNERKSRISKWIDQYIEEQFSDLKGFGHLLENHIQKSNQALMDRAKREKKTTSSFDQQENVIVEFLKQVMVEYKDELVDYMADSDDISPWELVAQLPEHITGRMYIYSREHNWKTGPLLCTHVFIILKKDHMGRAHVASAYPIIFA